MYVIAFIFLGILVAINKLMIPVFQITPAVGQQNIGLTNPCLANTNFICSVYSLPSYAFAFKDPNGIGAYYTSIFFYMSIIVGLACGLVAGQISENSIVAGLKHSAVLSIAIFGALLFLKAAGVLGV